MSHFGRPRSGIQPGQVILLHLISPTEKFWGVLEELGVAGVAFRGISVESFDDWVAQAVRSGSEPQSLGLSTMFVPLFRVERLFLDEAVGQVESYGQRFERRVGVAVEEYLGLDAGDLGGTEPS
jgi:hypothetical protein